MFLKRKIDHLVYAVPDLEAGMTWVEQAFGIRPVFGGYHQTQGTKNAVLRLGQESYLELLAIDPTNTEITAPRWMGVDGLDTPQITRWAIHSDDLENDSQVLQRYHPQMGSLQAGRRKKSDGELLIWQMLMPLATPTVEIIPFAIDWRKSSAHPTAGMPRNCQLIDLELTHPKPQLIQTVLNDLHIDTTVFQGAQASIKANFQTPNGLVQL